MRTEDVEQVLNEHVRPLLRAHGGDMEVLSLTDGVLRFRLLGRCSGCPAADLTTEELVKNELMQRLPAIRQVLLVQETDPGLLDQMRTLLRLRHETE